MSGQFPQRFCRHSNLPLFLAEISHHHWRAEGRMKSKPEHQGLTRLYKVQWLTCIQGPHRPRRHQPQALQLTRQAAQLKYGVQISALWAPRWLLWHFCSSGDLFAQVGQIGRYGIVTSVHKHTGPGNYSVEIGIFSFCCLLVIISQEVCETFERWLLHLAHFSVRDLIRDRMHTERRFIHG